MPKEDSSCVCLSVILIDSVFKIFKNNYPQMFLKEFKNIVKEKEVTRHITAEPEWWFFFSTRVFFHRHWRYTGQQGKGGDHLLFHSTTSTRSQTFRHLFATLHVRWLSHIFNCTACIYQAATWWDLPPYRITIWLTDDVTLSFCLFMWWFDSRFFLLQQFETWNRWIRTCIDYHPCIASESTNQVC